MLSPKTLKSLALGFGLLIGIALLAPVSASACSCIAPRGPLDELQQHELVFVGKVLSIDRTESDRGLGVNRVRFRVVRVFGDGRMSRKVTITTATNSAACGYPFTAGRHYVVYADSDEGVLSTHLCTRTAPVGNATDDLAAFGAPDLSRLDEPSPRCGGPSGIAAVQSALLVVGFLFARRLRHPTRRDFA